MKFFYSFFVVFCALLPSGLFAQNTLTVHQKDGKKFSYGFEEKPVVSFTDNDMIIKSSGTEIQYQLSLIDKFTFDDQETKVEGVKDKELKPDISLDENKILISGAKADVAVRLISSDGKLIQSSQTDNDGSASFSMADLPAGVYIINSDGISVKILKK